MCNNYRIGQKRAPTMREVDEIVGEAAKSLPSELVRRTGPGLVLLGEEGAWQPKVMRWGFPHAKYGEVNNTRSESLKSPFWAESLAERRCLVPMSEYFEWQELPAGAPKGLAKPCFSFTRPDGGYLWVAGVWQASETLGDCYSTITTKPSARAEVIHDRQLAVLEWEEALSFLAGDKMPWTPYEGPLHIQEVPSPLRRKPAREKPAGGNPPPPAQGELF